MFHCAMFSQVVQSSVILSYHLRVLAFMIKVKENNALIALLYVYFLYFRLFLCYCSFTNASTLQMRCQITHLTQNYVRAAFDASNEE